MPNVNGKYGPPRDNLIRAAFGGAVETRLGEAVEGVRTLFGHCAVFNEWTEINSWEGRFLERISPGAFQKTIDEGRRNLRCMFEHGMDPTYGSKSLGPIRKIEEDGTGLYYEVELLDCELNRSWLIPALEAEPPVVGASFRFKVIREDWNDKPTRSAYNPNRYPERTIKEVQLFELGPVTNGAYAAATAGVRNRAGMALWQNLDEEGRSELAKLLTRQQSDLTTGGAVEAPDAATEDRGDIPKAPANYRIATDIAEMCGTCDNYQANWGGCDEIAGAVDANYVCDMFEACDPATDDAEDATEGDDMPMVAGGRSAEAISIDVADPTADDDRVTYHSVKRSDTQVDAVPCSELPRADYPECKRAHLNEELRTLDDEADVDKEATDDTDVAAAESTERSDPDAATEATDDVPAEEGHPSRTTSAERRMRALKIKGII